MKDLSMHILDVAENSTRAGAENVSIDIEEDTVEGIMTVTITDDGKGMTADELRRALDPFYTSKTERAVGLGLPMLKRTAEQCGGSFDIQSQHGKGTRVRITMMMYHIDFPPIGDLNETMGVLIIGSPKVDFDLRYVVDGKEERFSTRDDMQSGSNIFEENPGSDINTNSRDNPPGNFRLRGEMNGQCHTKN